MFAAEREIDGETVQRLILFAKEPRPGGVKTRLAAAVGDAAAVRLYEAFLEDLAAELDGGAEWASVLAYGDDAPGPWLSGHFAGGWRVEPQGDGGLGERLARCLARAAAAGAERIVVAGSDAPTLTKRDVRSAFAALASGADVVLSPAPDGGYSLIGVARTVTPERLFDGVRWSSEHALSDTRAAAHAAGYTTLLVDGVPDVDVAADLPALEERLREYPELAPATRRTLAGVVRP